MVRTQIVLFYWVQAILDVMQNVKITFTTVDKIICTLPRQIGFIIIIVIIILYLAG